MYSRFISFFILAVSISTIAYSGTGGMDGGGGNAAELEFQTIGRLLSAKRGVLKAVGIDADDFAKAVKKTMIRSVNEVLRKEKREINAKNFPDENKIIFNLAEWKDLKPLPRIATVFHEYLGIARVERDHYSVSSLLKQNLSSREVQEIASEARPFANYSCKMTETEIKTKISHIDLTPKNCGTVNLTTRLMKRGAPNYLPFWHLFKEGGCRKTLLTLAGNGGYVDWSSSTKNVEFKIVIEPTSTPTQSSEPAFGQDREYLSGTFSFRQSSLEMDVYEHPSHFKMNHFSTRGPLPGLYMGKLGTVFMTNVECKRID